MLVARDYTGEDGGREIDFMPLDAWVSIWPWLDGYRKELNAGLAVFAEEGVFVTQEVWKQRNGR